MYLRPKDILRDYKVSSETLVSYCRQGLLTPILTAGGHRRYLDTDIDRLFGGNKNHPHHDLIELFRRHTQELMDLVKKCE